MIEAALEQLAVASLGAGLLVAFAMTLRILVRRDAVWRYRLLVVFLPLVIGVVPLQIVAGQIVPVWATTSYGASAAGTLRRVLPEGRASLHDATSARPDARSGVHVESASAPRDGRSAPPSALLSIYLAGVAVGLAVAAIRVRRAVRIVREGHAVRDEAVLALGAQVAADVGVPQPVRMLEHDRLEVPACWGLRRPAVVLPAGAAVDESLRCAVHHEMLHLRRHDPLVALIQMTIVVVFWFHPLVLLYDRALRRDRELSCDALVVRATRRPRTYALALLAFCEGHGRATALARLGSMTSMQRRLEMIRHARTPAGRTRAAMTVVVATIGVLAIVTAQGGLVAAARATVHDPPSGGATDTRPRAGADLMKAEIRAPKEGRGDAETLERIVSGWAAHGHRFDLSRPGQWLTDQETIVSARHAHVIDDELTALEVLLSLPEGSHTRALVEGEQVVIEPGAEETRMSVVGGTVRLVDRDGVVRAKAGADGGGTLLIGASMAHGEVGFVLRAVDPSGRDVPVRVTVDTETGRPEGEEQPPHKSNRFVLLTPDEGSEDPVRVKMQWIYDLYELRRDVDRQGRQR